MDMDPNQQPNPYQPTPEQPQQPLQPVAPQPEQPQPQIQQPEPLQPPVQSLPVPDPYPPAPVNYPEPVPNYDPNYLDAIAPQAARPNFFSGSFGKIFFIMIGVFVLAVSIIIAFSGKDKTADLQQTTVRVTNFYQLTKNEQDYLTSDKLSSTNSSFTLLLANAETAGQSLLKQAGVQKSQYNKTMVASEKKLDTNLTNQFENARLNGDLNSDYARTMAAETSKLISLFTTMSKQSQASKIRSYAKNLATNLTPLQKSFDGYVDDGN